LNAVAWVNLPGAGWSFDWIEVRLAMIVSPGVV
jgi:hypothetical protein